MREREGEAPDAAKLPCGDKKLVFLLPPRKAKRFQSHSSFSSIPKERKT